MKVYILKNRTTGKISNVLAGCRTDAKTFVVKEKGWAQEDVTLKAEREIVAPMEIGGDPYEAF